MSSLLETQPRPRATSLTFVSPRAQLAAAATVLALLFGACLVAPQPLWSGHPSGPSTPSSAATPFEPLGWAGLAIALAFALALCLPFRPYQLALRALDQARVPTPWLVALTALVATAALLIYPAYGSDIFDYVGFERMWAVYGDNPLLALPLNHPSDWATAFVWYPDRTPAYGPLWALLTWPIVKLAGDSAWAEVIGYKLLSLAAYAAICWLIWSTLEPSRRQRGLVMFAWSPLVLLEVLGKVHNDVLPALAMVTAVWLLHRQRSKAISLAVVTTGALVKVTALAMAPPVAIYLWRRGGARTALPATAAAGLLGVALYAPFWVGPASLAPIWNQTSRLVWGPTSAVLLAVPGGPASIAMRALLVLLCLALCGLVVLRNPVRTPAECAAASGWVVLTSTLLLTGAVYAHYFVPAVALASLSQDRRLHNLVLWLSIGGLAAYATELFGLAFGPDWLGSDAYRWVGTLMLLGPAVAMLAWRAATRERQSLIAAHG